MDDSLLAAVEAYLAGFVTTKASSYLSLDDASFEEQSGLFAEALVEWLGPGGDEAFLVMFLLAGGRLGEIVTPKFTSPLLVRSNSQENERRRQMTISAAMFLALVNTEENLGDRGFVYEARPAQEPGNDDVLFQVAKESVHASEIDGLAHSAKAVLVSQRAICVPWMSNRGPCLLTLRPNVDYRTQIMGELAQSWEVLPPPYGHYVPARRL